ncbi:MAG: M1 family metallopeptidase [Bryobacterales bacterium]|nr:M1 family metallopeptidase [Bryobacterales bacterium]
MMMRWFPLFAVLCLPSFGALSRQIASYDIKVTLDTKTHTLRGSEVMTWVNASPDRVATLQFHLYMNAFKNESSTFMRESGRRFRPDRFQKKEWGWIDVNRMQVVGGADLTKAIRFIHPDDGNAADQTVIEVPLPEPVPPGKSIQVAIDFTTKLPKVVARTGYHDEYYLVGQWFPKIGVYEKAGFRYAKQGRWNCHQFHANSEFFADFGRYRVEVTLPAQFVVGATGVEKLRKDDVKSGTSTYVFEQEDVIDFAWTASPLFQRIERKFDAEKLVSAQELAEVSRIHGISPAEARLKDVRMILLIQPEHSATIERHFKALETAIKYFGLWYGKYPYDTLTFVDPPFGAGGSGGMEYPTFITCGTPLRPMPGELDPETVIIHEFGHQYWMQMAATNEFEEPPLDEGFNTYSTTKICDLAYGASRLPFRAMTFNLGDILDMPKMKAVQLDRAGYLLDPVVDDLVRNSWSYYNSLSYSLNAYVRTGVTLDTLENILGGDVMARIMRTYFQTWQFNHPTMDDFIKVANQVSGSDLSPFFSQFVRGNRLLDYMVADVTSSKVRTPLGVFDKDGAKVTVDFKEAGKQESSQEKGKGYKPMYESVVNIRREGDAIWPVEVRVGFKDGSVERRQWDGQYRWTRFTFVKPSELADVEIDPERKLLLDVNWANNSYVMKPESAVLSKWASNVMFWMQNTVLWLGSVL